MEDHQLIARVLGGDASAERELYETHVERVYRLAYRMTGDETAAEDYTQETFLRTFNHLQDFRGRSALSTWIHSIAVSVVLSGLRKVKRLRSREVELSDAVSHRAAAGATDPALRMRLHRAIDSLPDDLRLPFVMHDVEGYRHREIAEILNIPSGTAKSRLFRARQELRDRLGGAEGLAREERR